MRTTKHGLNMGAMILIALVGVVAVNFLVVRNEKKFDWTSEGLNSLSDQSVKALDNLKSDAELVLLYRKEQDNENVQRNMRDLAQMFTDRSKRIKYVAYNALQRPDLAEKYDFKFGAFGLYLVSGDRHIKIDRPTEEEITKALIKLGRDKKKTIYFVTGHGERPLDGQTPEAISTLKKDLETTYDIKTLTLYQEGKVPPDADVVAVIGPQQQYIEAELNALRDYARQGGHLFLAIDPGDKNNLAQLTKTFGVEFKNNYILDPRAKVPGAGNVAALGTNFSGQSDVTRSFQNGMMTIFLLASALKPEPGGADNLKIDEIVKTDSHVVAANGLDQSAKLESTDQPQAIAMSVTGTLKAAPAPAKADGKVGKNSADAAKPAAPETKAESKPFSAIIVGDSDFLTNALLPSNLNRDLAMNSIAWLAKDQDLISIRPKAPKGTQLDLTRERFVGLLLGFLLPLPLLFFIGGGVIWWRRRTA
jgi:hypothetical protein